MGTCLLALHVARRFVSFYFFVFLIFSLVAATNRATTRFVYCSGG